MRGQFIVFEGLDGSGKSTQAALLARHFEEEEIPVLLTREPTGESEAGKKIAAVLAEKAEMAPLEFQKLFVEDRREHLARVILPALEAGKTAISDRYLFSTIAYGSLECGTEELVRLNSEFLYPDLTFLIAVSPEECVRRMMLRNEDPKFFEKLEKLKKVRETYDALARRFDGVHAINGERPQEEVFEDILHVVESSR